MKLHSTYSAKNDHLSCSPVVEKGVLSSALETNSETGADQLLFENDRISNSDMSIHQGDQEIDVEMQKEESKTPPGEQP